MFALPDHWIWDHWYLDDGSTRHLFFLRASRALHDPERRHARAAIGHAVSEDGGEWELTEDALVHADSPAFDSRSCWTGSAILHPDGGIRLFYTGTSREDDTFVQRIGWAHSDDGVRFERSGLAPLEADPRWYETMDNSEAPDTAWRDPYVFRGDDGIWHMLITANALEGPYGARAVVGHAVSEDLDHWEVRPPLTAPSGFGQLEVCQQHTIGGKNYLVFSCGHQNSTAVSDEGSQPEIWAAPGESPLGPWDIGRARPIGPREYYAGQLLIGDDGRPLLGGFVNMVDGRFVGAVGDPVPITLP